MNFPLTIGKELRDDFRILSIRRGLSVKALICQALKEFIARARSGGDLR